MPIINPFYDQIAKHGHVAHYNEAAMRIEELRLFRLDIDEGHSKAFNQNPDIEFPPFDPKKEADKEATTKDEDSCTDPGTACVALAISSCSRRPQTQCIIGLAASCTAFLVMTTAIVLPYWHIRTFPYGKHERSFQIHLTSIKKNYEEAGSCSYLGKENIWARAKEREEGKE